MTKEHTAKKLNLLIGVLVVWNILDIVVHVLVDRVEPLRITGNLIAICVVLLSYIRIIQKYVPTVATVSGLVVLALNIVHAYEHGFGIPMLFFVGISAYLLFRIAQMKIKKQAMSIYHNWLTSLLVTFVGIGVLVVAGIVFGVS